MLATSVTDVEKSNGKTNRGRFKKGERHPDQGRGPAKGAPNAGRPRDEWKAWLRSLVDSDGSRAAIETILTDPSHPAYGRILAWADERGYGKEKESVEVSGAGGGPLQVVVTRKVVRPDDAG